MSKDARDLIAYLREAIAKAENDDNFPPVQITEMAASSLIYELQFLIEQLEEAQQDIRDLLTERDRLEDELAAKD